MYAHATLARGAVESVAWLWWLLADGERFEARFGRGIAFLIEDAGWPPKQPTRCPVLPPGAQEQARQQALLARLDDARIERVYGPPWHPRQDDPRRSQRLPMPPSGA
ncbi:hypothetical protein [Micromonospora sp. NBC_00421]|uniref:hypothetical protein n=1 Tax=Micromonospora sp. NBC_00421 TaxID=2975976 RepID=UPI002E1CFD5E